MLKKMVNAFRCVTSSMISSSFAQVPRSSYSFCTRLTWKRIQLLLPERHVFLRYYSSQGTTSSLNKNLAKDKDKKVKTVEVVKIMLISETNDVSLVTLEEAQKIAKKKGLQLYPIDNKEGKIKTDKQVYTLSRTAATTRPSLEKSEKGKGKDDKHTQKEEKTLILHWKIAEHDLLSKVKHILKWIQKGHEVRVYIGQGVGGDNKGNAEAVYEIVEKNLKDFGRIVQKRTKGSEIRFQVLPPKETVPKISSPSETEVSDSNSTKSTDPKASDKKIEDTS